MLKSMTGFGTARCEVAGYNLVVEAKAVNGRFLKTSVKLPGFLAAQESALEAVMKAQLRRGSVTLSVFVSRLQESGDDAVAAVQVNEAMVRGYQAVFKRLGVSTDSIPTLPGVIGQSDRNDVPPALAEALLACAAQALEQLDAMRQREGAALAGVLRELCDQVERVRHAVRQRAPAVVGEYQQKLQQRLAALLAGVDVPVEPSVLAREVALFADRSDITEEVDRLGVHLAQVLMHLESPDGEVGRTLEFLAQEMHREVNTLGSKSADSEISQRVVQMKGDLERFKEQVANVQ